MMKNRIQDILLLSAMLALFAGCVKDNTPGDTDDVRTTVTLSLRSGTAMHTPDPIARNDDGLFSKLYVAAVSEGGRIDAHSFVDIAAGASTKDVQMQVPAGVKTFYAVAWGSSGQLSKTEEEIRAFTRLEQLTSLSTTGTQPRTASAQVFSGRTSSMSILASDRNRVIDLSILRIHARIDLYIRKNKEQLGDAPMTLKEVVLSNLRENSPVIFPSNGRYRDPVDFRRIKAFAPNITAEETVPGNDAAIPEDKSTAPQCTVYTFPVFPDAGASAAAKPRIAIKTQMADGTLFTYTANIEDATQAEHKGDLLPNRVYNVDAELGDRLANVTLEVLPWVGEPYRREHYLYREIEVEVLNPEFGTGLPTETGGRPKARITVKRTISGLPTDYQIEVVCPTGFKIKSGGAESQTKIFDGQVVEPVGTQRTFDVVHDAATPPTQNREFVTINFYALPKGSGIVRTCTLRVMPPKA